MADNLFEGLPPPSSQPQNHEQEREQQPAPTTKKRESSPLPAPAPILKSALKKPKTGSEDPVPQKSLRFKTTTDASEKQVIEAMQKIASHIKNPTKFGKASKLAIQMIQAGSVKPGTSDHFFAILEAAMSSSTSCTDPPVRADYHALFSAAQDAAECLNTKQKNLLSTWTIRAVVANDLFTDDSFVFSKTATRIKETISNLPIATDDDDVEEAAVLKETEGTDQDGQNKQDVASAALVEENKKDESDPFGLDALIPNKMKKEDKTKGKKDTVTKIKEDEEEHKRFLKSQRKALITCLEIAARRYKTPWCQTVIDILVKHAFDNVARFTSRQRDAIEKLWASIREQLTRRKQGKSVTGKLDVNAFEWLQQKYANENISIRHAVGGGGERRAQQWLG
ncbi:Nucleolar/coiled-body phosphoprotein [Melia azedarach]|uniref:Nucleolar/coiled-body phosphoprotein n=1 Tax=Melia azedarach TaxID=155640 RepID=A0ACC1Y7G0_MELAZ|nr:Nucleolar/coiled-body phosphoprotein [Melia azedarach]